MNLKLQEFKKNSLCDKTPLRRKDILISKVFAQEILIDAVETRRKILTLAPDHSLQKHTLLYNRINLIIRKGLQCKRGLPNA